MAQNLRSQLSQAAAYPGLGLYTRINSSFRVLCTPRPEYAAAYFLSYTAISIYVVGSKLQAYATSTKQLQHHPLETQYFIHPNGSPSEIFAVWTRHY